MLKSGTSLGNGAKYWGLAAQCSAKGSPNAPIWLAASRVHTIRSLKKTLEIGKYFYGESNNHAIVHPPVSHFHLFGDCVWHLFTLPLEVFLSIWGHCATCKKQHYLVASRQPATTHDNTINNIIARADTHPTPQHHTPLSALTNLISSSCLTLPMALPEMAALANWCRC